MLNFCFLKLKLSWCKSSYLLVLGFFKMNLLKGLALEACSFTPGVHLDVSVLFLYPDLEKYLSKCCVFGKIHFSFSIFLHRQSPQWIFWLLKPFTNTHWKKIQTQLKRISPLCPVRRPFCMHLSCSFQFLRFMAVTLGAKVIYMLCSRSSVREQRMDCLLTQAQLCVASGIYLFVYKFRLLCSRQNKTSNQKKMKNVVAFATSFYSKVFMQMQYFGIRQEDKKK